MKILDGHIHIMDTPAIPEKLAADMLAAEVAGGLLISLPPPAFPQVAAPHGFKERLDNLLGWMSAPGVELFPFFWIDPLEADAETQVAQAVAAGVAGFKIICDRYYPDNPRAMDIYRKIAAAELPILFHSGILWDGKPSSIYNRPAGFEVLMDIPGLRFALAHISWPWVDELIAVYGKLSCAARGQDGAAEMFVDTTRGTPPIYREEALRKLYTVGYEVANNVVFGSDRRADRFTRNDGARIDMEILRKTGVPESQIEAYFSGNLLRFISDKVNINNN